MHISLSKNLMEESLSLTKIVDVHSYCWPFDSNLKTIFFNCVQRFMKSCVKLYVTVTFRLGPFYKSNSSHRIPLDILYVDKHANLPP